MHERSARTALGTLASAALAFAAGALVMYLMDPNTGRRRRAIVRDRGLAMRNDAERYVRGKSKRAADRLRGVAARTRASMTSEPIDGQSAFGGRITGVDRGVVVLEEGRKTHRVPIANIKRGRLAVEF